MHTTNFKMALYSTALVTKLYKSSRKLYAEIITVKLKATLLLNASLYFHPLTFIAVTAKNYKRKTFLVGQRC